MSSWVCWHLWDYSDAWTQTGSSIKQHQQVEERSLVTTTYDKSSPLQILSNVSWMFWQEVIFSNGTLRNFFNWTGFMITSTILPALFSKHKVIAVVCSQGKGIQMKIPQVLLGDKCVWMWFQDHGCRFSSTTLKDNSVTSKLVLHIHVEFDQVTRFVSSSSMFPSQAVWYFLNYFVNCILHRMFVSA